MINLTAIMICLLFNYFPKVNILFYYSLALLPIKDSIDFIDFIAIILILGDLIMTPLLLKITMEYFQYLIFLIYLIIMFGNYYSVFIIILVIINHYYFWVKFNYLALFHFY